MNRKREQDQTEQIKCDVMNDERIMYRIHHRHNKDFTCQYCATVYETYGEKETDYRKKEIIQCIKCGADIKVAEQINGNWLPIMLNNTQIIKNNMQIMKAIIRILFCLYH